MNVRWTSKVPMMVLITDPMTMMEETTPSTSANAQMPTSVSCQTPAHHHAPLLVTVKEPPLNAAQARTVLKNQSLVSTKSRDWTTELAVLTSQVHVNAKSRTSMEENFATNQLNVLKNQKSQKFQSQDQDSVSLIT